MLSLRPLATLLFIVPSLMFGGCASNPATGSSDFVLMSEDQELSIGRQMHAEVLKQYGIYNDPALQSYVQSVGERLAARSHRPELIYRFTVLDSKEVNAFALPGGYIYITRGILAHLNSEAELAAVLGHEIGHVTARHAVRQYTANQAAGIGATLASIFIPGMGTQAGNLLVNVLGTAMLRGYGREHELESDRLGAGYAASNGYDPTAMLSVLTTLKSQELYEQQLAKQEGREARAYHGVFSTHPSSDTRLQEVVAQARDLQASGATLANREQFLQRINGLVVGDSQNQGTIRGNVFSHTELGFAFSIPQGWAVKNNPDNVLMIAPGGAAQMQMAAQDLNKRMSPQEFMVNQLGLTNMSFNGPLNSHGLEGYTAVSNINTNQGKRPARVSVLYHDNKAYIFAGIVEQANSAGAYDTAFLDSARSFHPLTAQERAMSKELRLKVVQAASGATYGQLAAQSPVGAQGEGQLRLYNGAYQGGQPQAGELIKIVQ